MKKKLAELIEMLCYDASGDEDERYIWRTIKKADSEGNGRRIKIDTETGKIETATLTLQKNIFSRDEIEINFEDIATIGAYIILNKEIPKEAEAEAETVEVEIEDE